MQWADHNQSRTTTRIINTHITLFSFKDSKLPVLGEANKTKDAIRRKDNQPSCCSTNGQTMYDLSSSSYLTLRVEIYRTFCSVVFFPACLLSPEL